MTSYPLRQLTRCFLALMSVLALSLAATAPGQETGSAPAQGAGVIRSSTRLVTVSVIVQDKKGGPVSGLTRDDFTVLDRGHAQKISVFSIEESRALPGPAQPLPASIFSNRWERQSGVPTSITVILLDGLNTRFEDQAYARQQVIKFLKQLQPQDRVALYTLGNGLHVVHDFTSDAAPLLRALERYRGRIPSELAASEPQEPSGLQGPSAASGDGSDSDSDSDVAALEAFISGAEQRMNAYYTTRRAEQTLLAIEAIANHLSQLPGRKNLVWVSGSFPAWMGYDSLDPTAEKRTFSEEIDRAVAALNNANLAIYPVDARGLMVNPELGASQRGGIASGRNPNNLTSAFATNQSATVGTMRELADRTGGKAFYNTNDLRGAVRSAIDDSRLTYVLGYYPTENQWDKRFHEIKVRVNRPGVRVRSRRGYFAMPEERLDEKQRKEVFDNAAWSPLDATGIGIYARLLPPEAGSDGTQLGVAVVINPKDITLQAHQIHSANRAHKAGEGDPSNKAGDANGASEASEDRWAASVDLLFLQRAADGKVLNGTLKTLNLELKSETFKKVMQEGLLVAGHEKLVPGASDFRVVVRDATSGSIGSVSIPLSKVLAKTATVPAPKTP